VSSNTASAIVAQLDRLSLWTGRLAAVCCALMAVCTGAIVLMRYGLGSGSVALQEFVSYLHSAVFMLGAAFTLQRQGHVRVDIFYRRFSERTRAWIDSIGAIVFLFPLCVFIAIVSHPYVVDAWSIREASGDPGGLPVVFVWKSLIPLLAVLLLLQGSAEILRNLMILSAPPRSC